MKKKLLALIDRHNAVVDALSECDLPVPEGKVFRAMEIWHKLACEGYDITHMAREAGIDAKCDMQAGRITVYGDIKESATDAEGVCPVCGGKIEHTGELIPTCGGVSLPWKCQECGATGDGCECERLDADEAEEVLAELEERSMRNAWQQDLIDLYRRER